MLNDLQDFQSTHKITAEGTKSREPIKEKPNWKQREKSGLIKPAPTPCLSQNYCKPQRRTQCEPAYNPHVRTWLGIKEIHKK